MGIINFLKKQFIDVIEWNENGDEVLAYRYPMQDHEIQNGGQLTVREGQAALFVNEGQVADLFGAGLHKLTTQNLPILTDLKNWDKAFLSPFKSDVVFFSTREKIDQKWGTPQPITLKDKDFGPIRLRAFGTYSFNLTDPKLFYKKLSGARDVYSLSDLEGQLKSMVATTLATFFGKGEIAFLEMAGNQSALSDHMKAALVETFSQYGLGVQTFFVQSISLPEEVQAYLDKSSSMRVLGDMQKYAQFQTADSIHLAAENPGGLGGLGAGVAVGQAIGSSMMNAFLGGGSSSSGSSSSNAGAANSSAASSAEVLATLTKLHELVAQGILTQAEFDAKKAELLKKI